MLFDLRSRGRRRTVQAIYLGLAILMGGGLVLFGVGAGNGLGGILNAFTGNGSGSAQTQVINQAEKDALKQTKLHPSDAAAWGSLLQARWTSAGEGSNYNSNTATFTASGRQELAAASQAWQRYLTLTKNPDSNLAILAARAYAAQANYSGEANAWEIETTSAPNEVKGFECLAVSAYAAKQTRKGDLAAAKALSLVPQLSRSQLKTQINAAKTNPTVAQGC
jgi:hypothetical protein